MITLNEFKTDSYELTDNEAAFMLSFLSANDCGSSTPIELIEDAFSCQCFADLVDLFPEMSKASIKGTLGSLVNKNVLWIEERDRFEGPDLYWVNTAYLEELNPELNWYGK